jgi:hypothetical protein
MRPSARFLQDTFPCLDPRLFDDPDADLGFSCGKSVQLLA